MNDKDLNKLVVNAELQKKLFDFFTLKVRIPACLNCGKLFDLGFPGTEQGISDNLICAANHMICECEHNNIVRNLYEMKKDGSVDTSRFYKRLAV